jgi:hypothetical protein
MSAIYKGFCIYRRLDNEVMIYRVFERLGDHCFFVQSADRVRLPVDPVLLRQHETGFLELLIEAPPEDRDTPHSTIEEAITAFDGDFGNESGR